MKTFSEFFGFKQTPFKRTPDVEFYYPTKVHQDALDTLFYMLQSDDAFTVVTGEPGTGKTITLRKFISELPNNIVFAYILFPSLTPEELFMAILEDFNIKIDKNMTKNGLYARLRDFLIEIGNQGKKAMIIIDEAQNMPLETLEELRILSNLETDKEKLLKIVLAGQPELDKKLASEELRQLSQRVTLYCNINNMPDYEIKNYIYFHLSKAGKSSIKIQNKVIKQISKLTLGNPRLINILMERTIIAAFLDNSYTIKDYHLTSAISSVNTIAAALKRQRSGFKPAYVGVAAAAAVILAIGGAYLTLKTPAGNPSTSVASTETVRAKPVSKPAVKPVEEKRNETPVNSVSRDNNITVIPIVPETVETNATPNVSVVERNDRTPNVLENSPADMVASATGGDIIITQDSISNANVSRNNVAREPGGNFVVNIINGTAPTSDGSTAPARTGGPEAAKMPVGTKVSVAASVLNLRENPSLKSPKVTSVSGGQEFMVMSENDYWVEIEPTPGMRGWVYKGYLKIVQ